MQISKLRSLVAAMALTLLAIPLAPVATADANENPRIIPNIALPHGSSYGDWLGAWWNWVSAEPIENNPVFDNTGALCGVNQTGQVWFMGGSIEPATRVCTMPAGRTIVYSPRSDFEWIPDWCSTPEECQATAAAITDLMDTVEMEIDGIPLQDMGQYRVTSHFNLDIREGTLWTQWGVPAGIKDTYGDGYLVMIAPLPVGEHVIHSLACISAWDSCEEVTYQLTVVPAN